MSPKEHYARAESLLADGAEVVKRISEAARMREDFRGQSRQPNSDQITLGELLREKTDRIAELSRKAAGIWAQAQVHATLATCPAHIAGGHRRVTETVSTMQSESNGPARQDQAIQENPENFFHSAGHGIAAEPATSRLQNVQPDC